jgi:hypothetical protein
MVFPALTAPHPSQGGGEMVLSFVRYAGYLAGDTPLSLPLAGRVAGEAGRVGRAALVSP